MEIPEVLIGGVLRTEATCKVDLGEEFKLGSSFVVIFRICVSSVINVLLALDSEEEESLNCAWVSVEAAASADEMLCRDCIVSVLAVVLLDLGVVADSKLDSA